MPTVRRQQHINHHNGHQVAVQQAGPHLGMKNLAVRLQNVPLSSLPDHFLPDNIASVKPHPHSSSKHPDNISDSGGYLDPETGMWIVEAKKASRSQSPSPETKS